MRTLAVTSALAVGLMIAGGIPASQAAPMAPTGPATKTLNLGSSVEQVQWGRYCRRWSWECRSRWGFGWRYRRCMARHGC